MSVNILLQEGQLIKNEGSRFAFQEYGKNFWLFVDGRQYTCSEAAGELVKTLCAERTFPNLFTGSQKNMIPCLLIC